MRTPDWLTAVRLVRAGAALLAVAGTWALIRAPEDRDPRPNPPMAEPRLAAPSGDSAAVDPGPPRRSPFLVAGTGVAPFEPGRYREVLAVLARDRESADPVPTGGPPALTIRGLLLGHAPLVVLDGVPDRRGATVFAPGDTAAGVTVESILPDGVRVRWLDTVFTVPLNRGVGG